MTMEASAATSNELILDARGITKRFGGFVALNNVDLAVRPGERLGLIGPNGSGKSTLTNCLCGALKTDGGSISFRGQGDRQSLVLSARAARAWPQLPAAAAVSQPVAARQSPHPAASMPSTRAAARI